MKSILLFKSIVLGLVVAMNTSSCQNSTSSKSHSDVNNSEKNTKSNPSHTQSTAALESSSHNASINVPAPTIPDFKFYQVRSGFGFEKAEIPKGRNTVFILFDPGCGHCQKEASMLSENYDKLKDINMIFVSMNDPELIDKFLTTFGKQLEGKANVQLLYDRDQQFIRKFHIPNIFPASYVYDAEGKLKTYWEGEKNASDIVRAFVQ